MTYAPIARIVNGQDGSDSGIAAFHRIFAGALQAGGWGAAPLAKLPNKPATAVKAPWWAQIVAAIVALFRKG